ncbi:MAG: hypothetical protein JSC189_001030 [Candidatus Tokpelaia sp. JSC189]|nr:MAG: hypothetical protein JSC189_001030 [Candidatus Tokpelaia sp. JSC189]
MIEVIATSKGYYGGLIREIGDCFTLDDAHWKHEERRPKWVRLVDDEGPSPGAIQNRTTKTAFKMKGGTLKESPADPIERIDL